MTDREVIQAATALLIDEAISRYGYAARDIYFYLKLPGLCNLLHKQDDNEKWPSAVHFFKVYQETREALMMPSQRIS